MFAVSLYFTDFIRGVIEKKRGTKKLVSRVLRGALTVRRAFSMKNSKNQSDNRWPDLYFASIFTTKASHSGDDVYEIIAG